MPLRFTKMQGVGNDFVVVDGREHMLDWSALAPIVCHRRYGVGADGLLVLSETPHADLRMRMFNPDGTEDVCGNGLRCVARYAVERARIPPSDQLTIEVLNGVRTVYLSYHSSGEISEIIVDMGPPRFAPPEIPMRASQEPVLRYPLPLPDGTVLPVTVLSTGSTHAVTFVNALPDNPQFQTISPMVEHHPLFPERTSLMWCQITGPAQISMRIWERGVGETWGCGTGACAAAVAAILEGRIPRGNAPIHVHSHGGSLRIQWMDGQSILMSGPAEFVYEGVWKRILP
ncbi:MAG: diaminopimelate epimerase [Chloroherpetonaceae bacterium]|nr:diaminopimelate epimerase [Chthonomonadaceae bacterium]MDW8207110.1 diaminopimelate epimerase [Chloroherpetonaceae bacterium]